MSRLRKTLIIAVVMALAIAVAVEIAGKRSNLKMPTASVPDASASYREAAVAGLFYPKEPDTLSKMLDALLAQASPKTPDGTIKALICPHAGYQFSGLTAAYAYKLLAGKSFDTVIVLAPSHYAPFNGASVCESDYYRTPLGIVKISSKAKELAKLPPFFREPHFAFQRPQWWMQSSRSAPDFGRDTPETWEHSGEVQVPFLQKVLSNFEVLPVVFGAVDPDQAAEALAGMIDDRTLIIASSDLSHYHPYEEAKAMDDRCVKGICALDGCQLQGESACGYMPILTVMHLAKLKGWKPALLDCRNSGDATGDKSRGVVGYASIAFTEGGSQKAEQRYSAGERKVLLELARKSLTEVVRKGAQPKVDDAAMAKSFGEPKGCFVTLTEQGQLRGCIGHIIAQMPLYQAIMQNAESAATRDTRFIRVQPEELDKIEIEISVLTNPEPLPFSSPEELLSKLQPHRDGVVLQMNGRGATYLPQVWEHFPKKEDFLNTLAQKAGCTPQQWREPGTRVFTYRVESFKEFDK